MIIMMRTTINLPDDVYEIARAAAHAKSISLGDALGELVRRALQAQPNVDTRSVFPSFSLPADAPPITLEQTLNAEDEL